MMLAIIVQGSSIAIFLFSMLEFLFMIPVALWVRRKNLPFRGFLKNVLWRSDQGKKNALFALASVVISFGMLILGPLIINMQELAISTAFGEVALQQARENLNQFVIVQPGIVDVVIYGATSFLVIALNEELFFRDFLPRVIGRSRGTRLLVTAALFAVYHLVTSMNLYSLVFMSPYYFVWGIVLFTEYRVSGEQLIFPITTHGLFNLLLLIL